MAPPSKLTISTSSLQRLVKEEASYHKELSQQQARITKLEQPSEDENAEYQLKQEVSSIFFPPNSPIMIIPSPNLITSKSNSLTNPLSLTPLNPSPKSRLSNVPSFRNQQCRITTNNYQIKETSPRRNKSRPPKHEKENSRRPRETRRTARSNRIRCSRDRSDKGKGGHCQCQGGCEG